MPEPADPRPSSERRTTHLNASRIRTYTCGCFIRVPLLHVFEPTVTYCPMHAAAPTLLAVCKHTEQAILTHESRAFANGASTLAPTDLGNARVSLLAAIAEAEPVKE